jgi:hypothetical protein
VPRELLEGIPTDPSGGGPYVMWGDTPIGSLDAFNLGAIEFSFIQRIKMTPMPG